MVVARQSYERRVSRGVVRLGARVPLVLSRMAGRITGETVSVARERGRPACRARSLPLSQAVQAVAMVAVHPLARLAGAEGPGTVRHRRGVGPESAQAAVGRAAARARCSYHAPPWHFPIRRKCQGLGPRPACCPVALVHRNRRTCRADVVRSRPTRRLVPCQNCRRARSRLTHRLTLRRSQSSRRPDGPRAAWRGSSSRRAAS